MARAPVQIKPLVLAFVEQGLALALAAIPKSLGSAPWLLEWTFPDPNYAAA
jgi:hypothetical protein